jgi:hypothetical protein
VSEADLQGKVLRVLWFHHAIPVENVKKSGTPDVAFIHGWIECKWLDQLPVRKGTIVRIEHFTGKQRLWLMQHSAFGGNCFLWLQIGREHFIFKGWYAAKHVGRVTVSELRKNALYYSTTFPELSELKEIGMICLLKTV